MDSKIHLIEYFPDYLSTDSLFTKMNSLGAPWSSEVGQDMDDAYFTMYSGVKNPSDFVLLHLNPDNDTANSLTIARILYGMYGDNWTKLWEAFKSKYTPIDNYNVQETVTTSKTTDRNINRTNNLTSSVDETGSQTSTTDSTENVSGSTGDNSTTNSDEKTTLEHGEVIDRTENQTVDGKTTSVSTTESDGTSSLEHGENVTRNAESDMYTYGFNSSEKVPTSVQIENGSESHTGTDTTTTKDNSTTSVEGTSKTTTDGKYNETHSGTDTTTTTDTTTIEATGNSKSDTVYNSQDEIKTTKNDTRTDKTVEDTMDNTEGTENIQRTRVGMIGQNTYQELLQQEFELWKWNFFTQVFEDVDKFLVLSVYSHCGRH